MTSHPFEPWMAPWCGTGPLPRSSQSYDDLPLGLGFAVQNRRRKLQMYPIDALWFVQTRDEHAKTTPELQASIVTHLQTPCPVEANNRANSLCREYAVVYAVGTSPRVVCPLENGAGRTIGIRTTVTTYQYDRIADEDP